MGVLRDKNAARVDEFRRRGLSRSRGSRRPGRISLLVLTDGPEYRSLPSDYSDRTAAEPRPCRCQIRESRDTRCLSGRGLSVKKNLPAGHELVQEVKITDVAR